MAAASVLSGAAPVSHLNDVMQLALKAMSVKAAHLKSVFAIPLPTLELPLAVKLLHEGAQRAQAMRA